MRYKHLLAITLLILLAACGQKRALFLPQEPPVTTEDAKPIEKQPLPNNPAKEPLS